VLAGVDNHHAFLDGFDRADRITIIAVNGRADILRVCGSGNHGRSGGKKSGQQRQLQGFHRCYLHLWT